MLVYSGIIVCASLLQLPFLISQKDRLFQRVPRLLQARRTIFKLLTVRKPHDSADRLAGGRRSTFDLREAGDDVPTVPNSCRPQCEQSHQTTERNHGNADPRDQIRGAFLASRQDASSCDVTSAWTHTQQHLTSRSLWKMSPLWRPNTCNLT